MDNDYEEYLIRQQKFKKNSVYGITGKPVKDKEFIDEMKRLYEIKENKKCVIH